MNKWIISLLFLLSQCSFAFALTDRQQDSARIEQLLSDSKLLKPSDNRILFFAKKFIGTPYVGGTLDKAKEERLVINTRQLDCTTFVENVLALALCSIRGEYHFQDFCRQLKNIRYRKGNIAYTNRLHYFTDWIEDNAEMGFVRKIESRKAPFTAIQNVKVDYMSKHSSAYAMLSAHPQWMEGIKKTEQRLTGKKYWYIPKNGINNSNLLRKTIHNGDIIAILTSKAGLDTSHIGFAVWKKDGLHLLNASQIHKKVILEPMLFRDYMRRHPSQIGIRICRMQ